MGGEGKPPAGPSGGFFVAGLGLKFVLLFD
jgi:hypothetical protein